MHYAFFQLGQHIRLMLEYAGVSYTEKLYEFEEDKDDFTIQWKREKFTLGMDLPNVIIYSFYLSLLFLISILENNPLCNLNLN